ncbi:MAG: hypothetical protein LBF41_08940, partial [Deltaproteobacteria bacterium]|nr:hypothetical protein [Deltaproteobacteria bacterium]
AHARDGDVQKARCFYTINDIDGIMPKDSEKWAEALENLSRLFLEAGKPEMAGKIFHKLGGFMLSTQRELSEARASIGLMTILHLLENDNADPALELFSELSKMGNVRAVSAMKARAALALIEHLSKRGYVGIAETMLSSLREYPRTQEIMALEGRAASVLMGHLEEDHEVAIKIYENYLPLADSNEYSKRLGKLAANVILILVNARETERASAFFEKFSATTDLKAVPKESLADLASVLANLAVAHTESGNLKNALRVLRVLEGDAFRFNHAEEIRALLSVNLVGACCANGMIGEAERIHDSIDAGDRPNAPGNPVVKRQKARAAVNIAASLMMNGLDRKAERILDEMKALREKHDIGDELAKAAANSVIILAERGSPEEALKHLRTLEDQGEEKTKELHRPKALAHLAASYAKLGKIEESMRHYAVLENEFRDFKHSPFRFFAASALLKALNEARDHARARTVVDNLMDFHKSNNREISPEIMRFMETPLDG